MRESMEIYPRAAAKRAMKLHEVLLRATAGKIKWWHAAKLIGISDRQMRRWRKRLEEQGPEGLLDRRRGTPSHRRIPKKQAEEVLALYRDKYFDLNVRHFHEKLREEHQIGLSYTWVKQALQAAGLVKRKAKRGVHRKRRQRRPLAGMLLHIDGKVLRRSFDRASGKSPLHMVSAWGCRQRLVLAQIATETKSNEITAVPKLLKMLTLEGAIVTTDALNCQRAIAEQIVEQKGDYALALKANQGTLHDDVVLLLEDPELKASRTRPLVEADHGRIETRTATVSTEIGWLQKQHQWPGLKAIGKVERTRETAEKTTTATAYYLLSSELTAERFNEVVRQHWSIENSLHWRLDVVMNEDQDRTRAGNGAHNLAVLRHMAINAMQKEGSKGSMRGKFNVPAGMTGSYLDSWRCFEMRLPWATNRNAFARHSAACTMCLRPKCSGKSAMKIVVVTICYSSTACIRSLSTVIANSSHEVECELFLHSRQPVPEQACAEFARNARVQYHAYGVNRGVSASWNEGIVASQARGADVTIVANDDIEFAPGDVEKLAARAMAHRGSYIISCAGTHLGTGHRVPSMGYSCFAINSVAIEKVGFFDENIFPAYCEDQDYAYRARLAGLQEENCADTELTHAGSASIWSDPRLLYQNAITQQKNMLYYRQKWGGFAGAETYRVPFNNPRLSIRIAPECKEWPYGPSYDRRDRHIVRV